MVRMVNIFVMTSLWRLDMWQLRRPISLL